MNEQDDDIITLPIKPSMPISAEDQAGFTDKTIIVTGLTELELGALQEGIQKALGGEQQGLVSKVSARIVGLSATMILVAGAIWVVAAILSNLPGR